MEIALVVSIVLAFGAVLLGFFVARALWLLRSTVDKDRASVAESVRRLRAGLDTALGGQEALAQQGATALAGIQSISSTVDLLRREVVSIGEEARLARREVTQLAATPAAQVSEAACSADPDDEVTLFLQRPANDGTPDRPPITPTMLSNVSAPPSPKA